MKNPKYFIERKPKRYFPAPISDDPNHRRCLKNFGTVMAIGVASGMAVEFRCSPALHAAIAGIGPNAKILRDEDPDLAQNL